MFYEYEDIPKLTRISLSTRYAYGNYIRYEELMPLASFLKQY